MLLLPAAMAMAKSPADSIWEVQFKALQDMRARAVVGTPPAWPAAAKDDSMPRTLITSDEGLPPNPETGFKVSGLDAASTTDSEPDSQADPAVSEPPPGMFGELRFAFALFDDFEMGGRLGAQIAHPGLPLDFFFDFEGRPFSKAVRVRESETLEYQFQEHRLTPSVGLSSRLPLGSDESAFWTFGGGVGLSFGYYRGSNRSAEVTFPAWIETGFRFKLSTGSYLGLGYQYFPLPFASSHRLAIVYGMRGPDKEAR
jgi:hypothetical protein